MLGSMLDAAMAESPQMSAEELLADLRQSEAMAPNSNVRRTARITDSSVITIRPASSSQRSLPSFQGRLRDAARGGVGLLTELPPAVGDVYVLTFEVSPFESSQVVARCMHCKLIREDAFESGFAFFAPVPLREDREDQV